MFVTLLLLPPNPRPAWDLFRGEAVRSEGVSAQAAEGVRIPRKTLGSKSLGAVKYLGQALGRQLWGLRAESHRGFKDVKTAAPHPVPDLGILPI